MNLWTDQEWDQRRDDPVELMGKLRAAGFPVQMMMNHKPYMPDFPMCETRWLRVQEIALGGALEDVKASLEPAAKPRKRKVKDE